MSPTRDRRGATSTRTLLLAGGAAVVLAGNGWLGYQLSTLKAEAAQRRTDASGAATATLDAQLAADRARLQSIMDRVRAEAANDKGLHLSVEVDSGTVTLERDGLVLRTMEADLGPESVVGTAPDTQRLATPRGVRTVKSVIAKGASYELPAWLWRERGLDVPEKRTLRNAFGPGAAFLEDGTLIYARTTEGPLSDSLYVWPGAIRLSLDDLKAVLPNLKPGVKVYLF
ncbi:MAG: hypothetical protein HY275_03475 [Gemmatimonadetes bacterium]|nr:hypothetical protein [Gemmatimonadota bacterium]